MTMPSSGPISLGQANTELGFSATALITMNDAAVRTLAGVGGSGTTWSMNSLYGKTNAFTLTISSNQTNADLRTLAVNAGWNQSTKVTATINNGIYISSNSTGTAALTISGSFPGGIDLINNGFIAGMGGAGGNGAGVSSDTGTKYPGTAGAGGGLALSVSSAVSITNNGTIGGGGGGGGGGQGAVVRFPDGSGGNYFVELRGGGGGGGQSGAAANSAGGAPGTPDIPLWISAQAQTGGAGTSSGAGSGGAGSQSNPTPGASGGTGGAGGTLGVGGATGAAGTNGGYFFVAGTQTGPYSGGSAGGAVSGNSNITWVATGTRLGAIT